MYRGSNILSTEGVNDINNIPFLDTVAIVEPPRDEVIEVNHTKFLHCIASYDPLVDVTYVWYENDVIIDFELVFRLGEEEYYVWYNPHFKLVSESFT